MQNTDASNNLTGPGYVILAWLAFIWTCLMANSVALAADDHRTKNIGSTFIVHVGFSEDGVGRDGTGVAVSDRHILVPYGLIADCTKCTIGIRGLGMKDDLKVILMPNPEEDPVFALLEIPEDANIALTPVLFTRKASRTWAKLYVATANPRTTVDGTVKTPKGTATREGEDWTNLLILSDDIACAPGTVGSGVFDAKSGELIGIVYGTYEAEGSAANGKTVAFNAALAFDFLKSRRITARQRER